MNDRSQRRLGRSILALFSGFVLVLVLTLISDVVLYRAAGVTSPGQMLPHRFLGIALAYRSVYAIAGSYLTARLAPYRPMAHAMIGGVIGLMIGVSGAVATWNSSFTQGAHWYSIAVALMSIPTAWIGGRICLAGMQPGL